MIFKTGNVIILTGNGIISPVSTLPIKNFFYKIFSILTKDFKICFQNGKWNYPNRKWNYFSHFRASYKNTSFTKSFSFLPRSLKLIFKTGNGFVSPTSRPRIKKILLQHILRINQGVQIWFLKQETELSKSEFELFLLLPGLKSNFFYNMFLIFINKFKIDYQNR